jgi:predicted GNAT family acetyltransferase
MPASDAPHGPVRHDEAASRFVIDTPRGEAVCHYRRSGHTAAFTHTEVPPALEGQGLAGRLVRAATDWARAEGLVVHAACSYVAAWMRRHPETLDLLRPPGR